MADNQYKEVLIVLIACIVLFLILAAIILWFLFQYQRRRFLQQRQLAELQVQFREQSLKAQLEMQEQTFQAISEEIHDNVGQLLSLAKVQINIINESKGMSKAMLEDVSENIGKAMADLRDLAKSLNSDRIRGVSIHETLLQEAERINRTGIIRADVVVDGMAREMDPQKKLILFRILQESIQNCIKHAEASRISISCQYQEKGVSVSICDDGNGFDPEAALEKASGQGLRNIQTRVRLTGGVYSIHSLLNEGTQITLSIPYE